jgi:hypothetical protein
LNQRRCVLVGDDIAVETVGAHDDVFEVRMIYAMRHLTDVPWKMMVRNKSPHHCYPRP